MTLKNKNKRMGLVPKWGKQKRKNKNVSTKWKMKN